MKIIHYSDLRLTLEKIEENAPKSSFKPICTYPNTDFREKLFSKDPKGKVAIIGYGSLMKKCAKDVHGNQTITTENSESVRPVIAFGVKRLFNYKEWRDISRVDFPREPNELAYLNIAPSLEKGSFINAAVMEVDEKDFAATVDREKGYDVVEVPYIDIDWNAPFQYGTKVEFKIGYAFMASNEKRVSKFDPKEKLIGDIKPGDMIHYTDGTILPFRDYVDYVDDAAKEMGPLFLDMYRNTTHLANGKLIGDWDRSVMNDEEVKKYEATRKK